MKRIFAMLFWTLVGTSGTDTVDAAEKSPPAQTINLLDSNVQLAADGNAVQTTHAEIHAGNDAAAMHIGQISIVYDSAMQDLEIVEAYTLKPTGEKIPVNVDAIYDQTPPGAAQLPMFTAQRMKVLVYPQFAAGDTAVYTVKLTSKHPYFPDQYWHSDLFPHATAFKEVRDTITAPSTLPLYVENHGVEFRKRVEGSSTVYSWHYSAPVPAEPVPETVSPLADTPRFFVSTFKDYAALGRAYAAEAAPQMTVTAKLRALADEITKNIADRREQVRKLYEWVSGHIRYVAIELGKGSLVPHDAETVLANGYGDCKDHVALLGVLLKAKGIDSEAVLINSTNDYTLTEVPTFIQLNHAITWVPEFNLYLDSTAIVAPFGVLPFQEYGKPIVYAALSHSAVATTPILPPGIATMTTKTVAQLDKAGRLTGTTVTSATGPIAVLLRLVGLRIQALGADTAAAKQLAALGYGSDATGHLDADSPTELSPRYTIKGEFSASGWSDKLSGNDTFYLPGGLRLFGLSGDGLMGSFAPGELKPDAELPCYSGQESEELSLTAPDNVHFASVPENTHVETSYLTFDAHWSLTGNTMTVKRDFVSRIAQPLCTAAIRKANADALKKILDSYNTELSFEAAKTDKKTETTQPKRPWYAADIARLPDDPKLAKMIEDALKAMRNNQTLEALQILSNLLKQPNLPIGASYPGLYDRAAVYTSLGLPDKALEDLDTALASTPGDERMLDSRAMTYFHLGDNAHALADCNAVLKDHPDDTFALHVRANVMMEDEKYEDALRDYSAELQVYPSDANAFVLRGIAYQKLGHHDEAVADIRHAAELGDTAAQSDFDTIVKAAPARRDTASQPQPDTNEQTTAQNSPYVNAHNAAQLGIMPPTPANSHELADYPPLSRRLEEEGAVIVRFTVNTDGSVSDPTVVQSSGFPGLDDAALDGVKTWRYHPATQAGKVLAVRTLARINWSLRS